MAMLIHKPLVLVIATRESHVHMLPFLSLLVETILFFKRNSHTDNLMIACISKTSQHSLKFSAETMNNLLILMGICTNMLQSILGQVVKLGQVLLHSHILLLQFDKLLQLHFHHPRRNMVSAKSSAKGSPWNLMSHQLGSMEISPPGTSRALELMCSVQGFLDIATADQTKLLSIVWIQSSASSGSSTLRNTGGLVLRKSAYVLFLGGS